MPLPGSSIQLVYDQLGGELESLGTEALNRAAAELAEGGSADGSTGVLGIFNPLALRPPGGDRSTGSPWSHRWLQPVQTPQGEKLLAPVTLKGLAVTALTQSKPRRAGNWEVSPLVLDNGVLRVEFDEAGQIQQASDRQSPGRWPAARSGAAPRPARPPLMPGRSTTAPRGRAWTTISGAALQRERERPGARRIERARPALARVELRAACAISWKPAATC